MQNNENRIIVEHVYKTFNVYLDKANSIKEKLLFWKRNRKETREVLKDINLTIKNGEAVALIGVNGSFLNLEQVSTLTFQEEKIYTLMLLYLV